VGNACPNPGTLNGALTPPPHPPLGPESYRIFSLFFPTLTLVLGVHFCSGFFGPKAVSGDAAVFFSQFRTFNRLFKIPKRVPFKRVVYGRETPFWNVILQIPLSHNACFLGSPRTKKTLSAGKSLRKSTPPSIIRFPKRPIDGKKFFVFRNFPPSF